VVFALVALAVAYPIFRTLWHRKRPAARISEAPI
jgi:hypothetical protein